MEKLPIELLKMDHEKVKKLYAEFHEESDPEKKKKMAEKIAGAFLLHAKIEEDLFYPKVREVSPEGESMIERSLKEHQNVKNYINQIKPMEVSAELETKMDKMEQDILAHVSFEESEVFPFAEQHIKDQLGLGMSAKIMEMKAKAML